VIVALNPPAALVPDVRAMAVSESLRAGGAGGAARTPIGYGQGIECRLQQDGPPDVTLAGQGAQTLLDQKFNHEVFPMG
jgi:hypothetical protein